MSISPQPNQEIRRLFHKYVPDVAAGVVEIVSVAREVGKGAIVAVHSQNSGTDPVAACVGVRGIYPKSVSRELAGERIIIVRWAEAPERQIFLAIAGYGPSTSQVPNVSLDAVEHCALIEVAPGTLDYLSSDGLLMRLISSLVGWDVRVVSRAKNLIRLTRIV